MDPEGDLAEVIERRREAVYDAAQLASVLLELLGNRRLRRAQRERERNQLLLRAVVQVAFDLAPGRVGRGHDIRRVVRGSPRRHGTGLLRVARLVPAVDAGRILNEKLARSQIIGGAVMGIGMTMLEETVFDPETGRIANATFADYLIPSHADVPDLDVVFVGTPDTVRPLGIKGVGEIGVVGVSAAIANAVYHATGRRIRALPITVEQWL